LSATLVFSAQMQQQIRRADSWWREHRPAAGDLFASELQGALDLLSEHPLAGKGIAIPGYLDIRRLDLRRTRYFVLYEYDAATDTVFVDAVWSSLRGRGPRLLKP
jgi:plasmid stabilization system protein ParE